jgi:hypothetical protein
MRLAEPWKGLLLYILRITIKHQKGSRTLLSFLWNGGRGENDGVPRDH